MVVIFTIIEINYLVVSLFSIWCGPFCIYICGIRFFDCAICFVSGIATKLAMPSLKVIYYILKVVHQAELFSNKIFSLNSLLQFVLFMVLF